MKKSALLLIFILAAVSILSTTARAQQITWIIDILNNKARYWNTEVTISGQVQTVTPVQPGSVRGTYTLLDDSCPTPLTIRTNDLPPVSKDFKVTGVIIQDPGQADVPIMKELSRAAPGMPSTTLYLLIGAGVIFLVLLIVFIVLLTKPKKTAGAAETIRAPARPAPTYVPPAPAPDFSRTTRVAASATPPPAKTQVFVNLGADVVVERGPDKGKEFALYQQVTTIGRVGTRKNDIELNDDTVSKEQAAIYYDNAKRLFSIVNESATNPTKVNGAVIASPTLLENGTLVELGRTVLVFRKG